MKKASFLTRLRFSYTYALLESLFDALKERGAQDRQTSSVKVRLTHPAR